VQAEIERQPDRPITSSYMATGVVWKVRSIEQGTNASQQLLRHQDPRMIAEAYHQIDTSETTEEVGDVFKQPDN
jgi:hypothetical protein